MNDERNVARFDDEIYVRYSSTQKTHSQGRGRDDEVRGGAVERLFASSVYVMALQIR